MRSASVDPVHAYLFVGPAGSGKRRAAQSFAAEVLSGGTAPVDAERHVRLALAGIHPDLVMMDIVMPNRSGIDAVKGIVAMDPTARVVMCSALGQETLVTEAIQAGAKDFIVKPFKPESVVATLRKTLEKQS